MKQNEKISALQIIQSEYERNPARSLLAVGDSASCRRMGETDSCIGAWSESQGRFVTVAARFITGEWASMPYEILINGELPKIEWTPIPCHVSLEAESEMERGRR